MRSDRLFIGIRLRRTAHRVKSPIGRSIVLSLSTSSRVDVDPSSSHVVRDGRRPKRNISRQTINKHEKDGRKKPVGTAQNKKERLVSTCLIDPPHPSCTVRIIALTLCRNAHSFTDGKLVLYVIHLHRLLEPSCPCYASSSCHLLDTTSKPAHFITGRNGE